ncbi:MAG: DUF1579 family protein [Myxococcales bacterium]|nr:DUF1579 family protein [Myxococcales bacterium]
MLALRVLPALALAACATAAAPVPSTAPATPPAPTPPTSVAVACAAPEHRQLDFWIGDWALVVKTRAAPDGPWAEAHATQRVEAILGGCVIAEHFEADGPGTPWAGRSYSMWQPALGAWRQTWVDDQGGFLAFTGAVEDGAMTLYGEPRDQGGHRVQMRMVFLDVTADALRWEWQRSVDDGAWDPQLVIEYRRRAAG